MQPIQDIQKHFRQFSNNGFCHQVRLSDTVFCIYNGCSYWARYYYTPQHSEEVYYIGEFNTDPEPLEWECEGELVVEYELPAMTEQRAREYYEAHIKVS